MLATKVLKAHIKPFLKVCLLLSCLQTCSLISLVPKHYLPKQDHNIIGQCGYHLFLGHSRNTMQLLG